MMREANSRFALHESRLRPLVGVRTYYLAGAFFASYAAMAGLFALLTGVCPVPSKLPFFYYVYEDGHYLRKVGRLQIGIAFVVAAASIFLTLVPVFP